MNKYVEFTVTTTHLGSELISDLLSEYTEQGVFISDIQDVLDLERTGKNWDYADDNVYSQDKRVLIKAFFPDSEAKEIISQIEKRLIALKEFCEFDLGTLETVKREIDGDLWREQWKEHFKPIHIGDIVILPEWIEYNAKENETVVLLDSNMAFGTGEHETTSMCVDYLGKYVTPNQTVLDVGCGSGILGITASKLGAKDVIMTDIDECAVTATTHNMKLNNITNGKVYLKNLLDDNTVKGDIIVANIMAELLISFAPNIGGNLKDNGVIILSGILTDRVDKVIKAYTDNGFTFIEQTIKGEWAAIVLSKNK